MSLYGSLELKIMILVTMKCTENAAVTFTYRAMEHILIRLNRTPFLRILPTAVFHAVERLNPHSLFLIDQKLLEPNSFIANIRTQSTYTNIKEFSQI